MIKKISVAIITCNEQERIRDCLKSVSIADELVVVDSGSSDNTVEIARSMGARVIEESWRGFSQQKQLAVDSCKHDWVLIVDADERVPSFTWEVIRQELMDNRPDVTAYSFKRKNFLNNRWIRHCGWWPDRIVRLVHKKKGQFEQRSVHEKWVTMGKIKNLNAIIEHLTYKNFSDMVQKMERYSTLAAQDLFKAGVRAGPMDPVSHGLWMFFKTYVLERGIFSGFDGILISVMNAMGSFLKYAKLREMNRS